MQTVEILGVRVHNVDMKEVLAKVEEYIHSGSPHLICTPNVDHIMKAQKDDEFRAIINNTDLAIPDGMGIIYGSRLLGRPLKGNVGGRLLVLEVCRLATQRGFRVFFLGAGPGVAARAAEVLKVRFPGLQVVGTYSPPVNFDHRHSENASVQSLVKGARPHVLFVGLGAPKQEKWLAHHLESLGTPVGVGVGVAFDVITGHIKEPPKWVTAMGLEWLFRLVQEPGRLWRRYLLENPRFFYLISRERVSRWSRGLRQVG